MRMQIFFPRSKPATNMPLLLVYIKNLPHLNSQSRIDHFQAFYAILMYGRY